VGGKGTMLRVFVLDPSSSSELTRFEEHLIGMGEREGLGNEGHVETAPCVNGMRERSLGDTSKPNLGTFEKISPKYGIRVDDSTPGFRYSGCSQDSRIRKKTQNMRSKFWG